MLDDVLQAFLGDAVQRDLDVLGQSDVGQVEFDVQLRDRPGEAGQPAGQTQVVEHRRAQPADRRARFVQRQADQFAGLGELSGGLVRVGADGPRRRVEPVGQRDQPLRDAVVDVAGDPATFDLLRLDHLLDEQSRGRVPGPPAAGATGPDAWPRR